MTSTALQAKMRTALTPLSRLPSTLYALAVQKGHLLPDRLQQSALPTLDNLVQRLPPHEQAMQEHSEVLSHWEQARQSAVQKEHRRVKNLSALGRAWRDVSLRARQIDPRLPAEALPDSYYGLQERAKAPMPPRGVYLYGDVGCGKSLLMDMMFRCAEGSGMRVHYHAFMNAVYEMLHQYDSMSVGERARMGFGHALDAVVALKLRRMNSVGGGGGLLCFDEFQVNDVADARLMHGILKRLMYAGTVVCFTSNRAPGELNRSQLQEGDFKGFLELVEGRCEMMEMKGRDYRRVLEEVDGGGKWYFGAGEGGRVREVWRRETGVEWDDVVSRVVPVAYGRELRLDRVRGEAVQVSTREVLEAPVGASDFRALVGGVRTVFFEDVVPVFTAETRNLARRFITLVDVCYEERVRLIMRMEAERLEDMFGGVEGEVDVALAEGVQFEGEVGKMVGGLGKVGGNLYTGEDERFAFDRAVSRLREMSTDGFQQRGELFS